MAVKNKVTGDSKRPVFLKQYENKSWKKKQLNQT